MRQPDRAPDGQRTPGTRRARLPVLARATPVRPCLAFLACLAAASPASALEQTAAAPVMLRAGDGGEIAVETPALSPQASAITAALAAMPAPEKPREKAILDAVRAMYHANSHAPLWFNGSAPRAQAIALVNRMAAADEDGLDPRDYLHPALPAAALSAPEALAEAELAMSLAAARFLTHLASGRVEPAAISRLITLDSKPPDIAAVLPALARAYDPVAMLADHEPPHEQYRALKTRLQALRRAPRAEAVAAIPEGAPLRPGVLDSRVPLLRARFDLTPAPDADPESYDDALAEAVRAFQAGAGLGADAIVGPRTLGALNGVPREREVAETLANMERWRWTPRERGAFHVEVNVPEFMARIRSGGEIVHETRIVVGKPDSATPIFSDEMDHIVVNPYWNVPSSIVTNEMLPEIQADPAGYFAAQGYEVLAKVDGRTRVVDPASIDWWAADLKALRVRQPPGEANALGRIKFMFPNAHDVYLHDTPSKSLFKRDARAFSHGCVRVDEPLAFADALLAGEPEWTAARIEKLFGGPERRIDLARKIPVHIGYFTLRVEADGTVRRFPDLYGFDRRLMRAMGISAGS